MAARRRPAPFPTRTAILRFIEESPGRVGKREIARAFGIGSDQRIALKELLADMAAAGEIGRRRRTVEPAGRLPKVTVIEITENDVDGEVSARPVSWRDDSPPPRIVLAPGRGATRAPGPGDRVLARLTQKEGFYEAKAMRLVGSAPSEVLGVYQVIGGNGRLVPTDRRMRSEFSVAAGDRGGAQPGELVAAEILPGRRLGLPEARVRQRLGDVVAFGAYSTIAIHSHGIPTRFDSEALTEAAGATVPRLGARSDLRGLEFVTIDPEEARDHDDAVWAEPDADSSGGWHIVIAIADVAHYVRPAGALDQAAQERGFSVYFPDRVVPMLPEALSADVCSLMRDEDRGCLAVHITIDAEGNKKRHEFVRGLMRVRANLTYEQVQAARDGGAELPAGDGSAIPALYGAYAALQRARARRGPLELELPERRVRIGDDGKVVAIDTPPRLDSHRLIEEYMIAANVCAAETLERRRTPCMYRVHDVPAPEKVDALRDFLATLGHRLAKGQVLQPALFNRILNKAAGQPHAHLINEVILRSQAQAAYSPDNYGHFGLALSRYAHFTSPIRRYADVLVHRGLISALGLGDDGLAADAADTFPRTAEQISAAERRAVAAERDALGRFVTAFMEDRVGASFAGRISGVTRFGLFVALDESGADGLIPIASLADDYYDHDEPRHSLIGRHSGRAYRLGNAVVVRLVEAVPLTGGLRLELLEDGGIEPPKPARTPRSAKGARRARRR